MLLFFLEKKEKKKQAKQEKCPVNQGIQQGAKKSQENAAYIYTSIPILEQKVYSSKIGKKKNKTCFFFFQENQDY